MKDLKYIKTPREEIKATNEMILQATEYEDKIDITKSRVHRKIAKELERKLLLGESRGEVKHQAMEEGKRLAKQAGKPYNMIESSRLDGIYSLKTYEGYQEIANRYADYLLSQNIKKHTKETAIEYLRSIEPTTKTATLKTYRSGLNKIYNGEINYQPPKTEKRDRDRLTTRARHFSEEKNDRLVTYAKATGMRRNELENTRYKDYIKNPQTGLYDKVIITGKGGKTRLATIDPQYQRKITRDIDTHTKNPSRNQTKLFERIHNAANIHAYRREYARNIYDYIQQDPYMKSKMYREIEETPEYVEKHIDRDLDSLYTKQSYYKQENPGRERTPYDRDIKRLKMAKTPTRYSTQANGNIDRDYKTRDGYIFDRRSVWITSVNLGHNRVETSIVNYLKR